MAASKPVTKLLRVQTILVCMRGGGAMKEQKTFPPRTPAVEICGVQ